MSTFLTTREVQDLINVDRSTVYRMAEDGRLPGVKIGRQWRFPADRIAAQFGTGGPPAVELTPPPAPSAPMSSTADLRQLLVPDAAQSVADLLGDLFDVMAVVTDMDGRPLTAVANPCGFYAAIADRPNAAEACLEQWRRLAQEPDMAPRFTPSHLGFLCARSFIRVGSQLVGMVIVGGVTAADGPPSIDDLQRVADELGISVDTLAAVADQTWHLDEQQQDWVLGMLPRVADLISQLASARSQLLHKLDAIATLAGPVATQEGTRS
jgi:excisionase family DNA binding protein